MEIKKTNFLTDFVVDNSAEASINLGGRANWIKFIVTDDIPNGNNQKIPREEFSNLIKTGVYMPIKMASGSPKDGHDNAFPLGTITNLKETENKVEGLGLLWSKERPDDIDYIGNKTKNGNLPQLSWEISYADSTVDESGTESLFGTSLDAVCIVGMPAYAGRTPIVAFASKNNDMEDNSVEELEQLKAQVEDLERKINESKTLIDQYESELTGLRQYKASIEEKEAKDLAFAGIIQKFKDAGIEKDEEYFSTNKDNLLSLPDTAVDFMIQELASLSNRTVSASRKVEIPQIKSDTILNSDPKELGRLLRESKNK